MNILKYLTFVALCALLATSCTKDHGNEPNPSSTTISNIQTTEMDTPDTYEIKDRVTLNLEGLTDIELPRELRSLVFNPDGAGSADNPYLKIKDGATKAKARVYFANSNGGKAFSGDTEASISIEQGKIKVALKEVVVALPNSINTTEEWYISVVLGGVNNNGTLAFNTRKTEKVNERLPEFNLPIISEWKKVKVIAGVPTNPEQGYNSAGTHRAEPLNENDKLDFKVQGSVVKVTLANRLLYNISAYDLRIHSNIYTAGSVAFPREMNVTAAEVKAQGFGIQPSQTAAGVALKAIGENYTTIVPLSENQTETTDYEDKAYYVGNESMPLGQGMNLAFRIDAPVYILLCKRPTQPDIAMPEHKAYMTVGVSRQEDGLNERIISLSSRRTLPLTDTDKSKVYNTTMEISSEPMITEIYMRTNSMGQNVGIIEIHNPALQTPSTGLVSLKNYGLIRLYRDGNGYKFYPNTDNIEEATVVPLEFGYGTNVPTPQALYTETYGTGNKHTNPMRYGETLVGGGSYKWGNRNPNRFFQGTTIAIGMSGFASARPNEPDWFGGHARIDSNSAPDRKGTPETYREGALTGRFYKGTEAYGMHSDANPYRHHVLGEDINGKNNERFLLREIAYFCVNVMDGSSAYTNDYNQITGPPLSAASKMHGFVFYNDAEDKTVEDQNHLDPTSGVMNGAEDDMFLLVKRTKSGKWMIVDMAGVHHRDAFAEAKTTINNAVTNLKHHVRHRVPQNITALSTEYDKYAVELEKNILKKLWTMENYTVRQNEKALPNDAHTAPVVSNASIGWREGGLPRKPGPTWPYDPNQSYISLTTQNP